MLISHILRVVKNQMLMFVSKSHNNLKFTPASSKFPVIIILFFRKIHAQFYILTYFLLRKNVCRVKKNTTERLTLRRTK